MQVQTCLLGKIGLRLMRHFFSIHNRTRGVRESKGGMAWQSAPRGGGKLADTCMHTRYKHRRERGEREDGKERGKRGLLCETATHSPMHRVEKSRGGYF